MDLSRNKLQNFTVKISTSIHTLDISFNQLKELPLSLSRYQNLTELNLRNNQITQLSTDIGQLDSLIFLDLSFNQISELPDSFGELLSLETLYLNNNQLTTSGCRLGALCSLQMIDLSQNQLISFPDITYLARLFKLYLNNNKIKEIPRDIIMMPKLKELSLRNNQIKSIPDRVGDLCMLTLLDLDENPLPFSEKELFTSHQIALIQSYLKSDAAHKSTLLNDFKKSKQKPQNLLFSKDEFQFQSNNNIKNNNNNNNNNNNLKKSEREESRVIPYTCRLFQVEGKEKVFVTKVELTSSSLNEYDVFILDTGKKIFIWKPPNHLISNNGNQNINQLLKAQSYAENISKELGNIEIVILNSYELDDSPLLPNGYEFWDKLGGKRTFSSTPLLSDDDLQLKYYSRIKIYKSEEDDRTKRCEIILISENQPIYYDMLNSSHCYVIDCWSNIFVWAGTESSVNEKSWALLKADELEGEVIHSNRLNCTNISWIIDGNELFVFKDYFEDLRDNQWQSQVHKVKSQKLKPHLMISSTSSEEGDTPEIDQKMQISNYDQLIRMKLKEEQKGRNREKKLDNKSASIADFFTKTTSILHSFKSTFSNPQSSSSPSSSTSSPSSSAPTSPSIKRNIHIDDSFDIEEVPVEEFDLPLDLINNNNNNNNNKNKIEQSKKEENIINKDNIKENTSTPSLSPSPSPSPLSSSIATQRK